jgi:hypothetical protein
LLLLQLLLLLIGQLAACATTSDKIKLFPLNGF